MAKNAFERIETAQALYEAGFTSKAGQKRALDELNYAYSGLREALMTVILAARSPETETQNHADYWGVASDLHQVRDRHFEIAGRYNAPGFAIVRDMIALRLAIKAADIAPPPARPELEVKAEVVRRSIVEEMERRKAMFIEGLDLGRVFAELFPRKNKAGETIPSASLPVSVNSHWVHGHKGTNFTRNFFYLNGKLTPLQTIMAIAQTLDQEVGA